MSKKNDCWGIEVGANAIKAIRLINEGGEVRVADYDVLPFKKVLTTPDLDVDEAVQVNLDQFLSRHEIARSSVAVSVPGHSAFARFAKLPPVEPKQIAEIVRYEAMQQIPFPIDQVEWDYQIFQQPDSPDVEVGIFAITKDKVAQFLANYRSVGIEIEQLTLSPLAVYNAMAYDMKLTSSSPGVILMDIGTQSTDLIIVEQGQIWLRTLPIGGNNFTEALVRAFKLSFPKAEKLKREAATSKYAKQIFQAMRPIFADLVQEMQRSLGYYQSMNRDAQLETIVGMGSTFRLPGLQKFLKQQLQLEMIRLDSFKRISVDGKDAADFAEHTMNMATAYGLALQGLGLGVVGANVLPQHIVKQRVWKAKQPWIAAAAAMVALATGIAGAKLFTERSTYFSNVQNNRDRFGQVVDRAQNFVTQYEGIVRDDPRQKIENFRRAIDYHHVWPMFLADVSMAAESIGPQQELRTADYSRYTSIPRPQRRLVALESVTSRYVLQGSSADGQPPTADALWGTEGEDGQVIQPDPATTTPPSYVITMTGTTPSANASQVVTNFIDWFASNADRADRPYTFIVDRADALRSLESVGGAGGRPAGDVSGPDPFGDEFSDPGRGGRPPAGGIGGRPPGGGIGGRPAGGGIGAPPSPGAGAPADRVGITHEFPVRPTAEEDASTDRRFVIEIRMQLRRPEAARRSEVHFAQLRDQDQTPEGTPATPPVPETDEIPQPAADAGPDADDTAAGSEQFSDAGQEGSR